MHFRDRRLIGMESDYDDVDHVSGLTVASGLIIARELFVCV